MLLAVSPIGHVTKAPILRESARTAVKYLHLDIAVDIGYGDKKNTVFFDATFFGEKAERLNRANVKKGSFVQLAGNITGVSSYCPEGGDETRSTIRMYASDWCFVPVASLSGIVSASDEMPKAIQPAMASVDPNAFEEIECGPTGALPD